MEGRSSCADCAPWAPSPNRPGRLRETPGGLTLARAHGYWKRCTLQKSSATATTRSLWERHRELMSVPSEPSGHTPSTVAGLSAASSLPPPTAQSCTVSQTPAAATTHRPRFRQPLPREGQGASGASWTGSSSFLMPTPPYTRSIPTPGWARPRPPPPLPAHAHTLRVPPCAPAHHRHGSPARKCRWPTPGLGSHSDSSAACSLQPRPLGRGTPPSSALTSPQWGRCHVVKARLERLA